jgi:hypothetical protein
MKIGAFTHMGIFAYMWNKIHNTKPINNLIIEMHAFVDILVVSARCDPI